MKNLLAVVAALILCSGCFTSEQPFYEERDVVTDDRLIGDYDGGKPYHWEITKDGRTYGAMVVCIGENKTCSMRFTGVLFRLGANTFFDLLPVTEEACDHSTGGTAPAPGLIEMLQAFTIQPLHMVIKIDIETNEIKVGGVDDKNVQFTKEEAHEYFMNWSGPVHSSPGGALRIYPDTQLERQFLLKFGSNTNIFLMQTMKRLTSKK